MARRWIIGPVGGVLAVIVLALAPQALARESAKFKVLSVSGSTTGSRDVVYEPDGFTTCSYSQTERITFHSTKRVTAYAFTSKAHGRARVAWSEKRMYTNNFTEVAVPGEVTVSRAATYQQSVFFDPESGETTYGCRHEVHLDGSPATDCTVERTMPATLYLGGTSDSAHSTYVFADVGRSAEDALDAACEVGFTAGVDDPRLFSRANLFKPKKKRLSDTDRVDSPAFDNSTDETSVSGTSVSELAGELKRLKQRP